MAKWEQHNCAGNHCYQFTMHRRRPYSNWVPKCHVCNTIEERQAGHIFGGSGCLDSAEEKRCKYGKKNSP